MEFKDLKPGDIIAKDFSSEKYLVYEVTESKPKCKIIGGDNQLIDYPYDSLVFIGGHLIK